VWRSFRQAGSALAVALLVLCFAAAASYFDEPGGAYVYTREAFGPFVGRGVLTPRKFVGF